MRLRTWVIASVAVAASALAAPNATADGAVDIVSSVDAAALPKSMRTPLGLYLTPTDAHRALLAAPQILLIDVRDPVEVSFVGHAEGTDANVPLATATQEFDPKSGRYKMEPNTGFVDQVEAVRTEAGLGKDAAVFLICRSGARSAAAARMLAQAGYTSAYNIVEGFEGDRDAASGARSVNGWRNAGLPWRYRLEADVAWRPDRGCQTAGAC